MDDVELDSLAAPSLARRRVFQVLTATDGPSALDTAALELPDIILLDVMITTRPCAGLP
jgi:CheY-like chemotaxis protein